MEIHLLSRDRVYDVIFVRAYQSLAWASSKKGEVMSLLLNEQQQTRAIEVMHEYLSATKIENGKTPVESDETLDENRKQLLESELIGLVNDYLGGQIGLSDFKTQIDSINKRNQYWGFKGIKGQMFFNMIVNVADDLDELDQELKSAISMPSNEQIASSRIKTFFSYVNRLREDWIENGNSKYKAPKTGSIPFFISYFWQIQSWQTWPVYYTTAVNALSDLNIWFPTENLAADYLAFKKINEELMTIFSKASGQLFTLYDVEHVLYYKSEAPYQPTESKKEPDLKTETFEDEPPKDDEERIEKQIALLPDSYVPPIIAILPQMARHSPDLVEAASRSGTSLPRAFEKNINAAFTILGYETKLLGQGAGRVPDGLARAEDENYAIIWDAKVRADGYSMGTDDRTIKEYIVTQSRDLKRRRSLRNIYYAIISSKFADDFDESIRTIKMETDVSEVCLMEAGALVAMIDVKLRTPMQITLGPDGIQRLFSNSGVLTGEMVREYLL